MSKTKIIVQIQKIDEMIKVLEEACTYFEWCLKEAEKSIETSVAQGFPEDKAKDYKENHWNPAKDKVMKVSNAIMSTHIPYLNRVRGGLMQILSM